MSHRREEKDERKAQELLAAKEIEREQRINEFAHQFDPNTAPDVDFFTCSMDTEHEDDCVEVEKGDNPQFEMENWTGRGRPDGRPCLKIDKWDLGIHFQQVQLTHHGISIDNWGTDIFTQVVRIDAVIDSLVEAGLVTMDQLNLAFAKNKYKKMVELVEFAAPQIEAARKQALIPHPGEVPPGVNGRPGPGGIVDEFGRRFGGDM